MEVFVRNTFCPVSKLTTSLRNVTQGDRALEKVENRTCPRCGQSHLNIYYSDNADDRLGAWCEGCNLKAYYSGEQLVSLN